MRVDPGRPGIARPGERADDPLAVQRGAKAFVAHVLFDHVGDRGVEQHLDAPPGRRRTAPRARRGRARRRATCRGRGRRRRAAVAGCARTAPRTRGSRRRRWARGRGSPWRSAPRSSPLGEGRAVLERGPLRRIADERPVAVAGRSSSSMTIGCSRPTRYAHGLTTKRGSANGRSSVHAPPSCSRRSRTSTARPRPPSTRPP